MEQQAQAALDMDEHCFYVPTWLALEKELILGKRVDLGGIMSVRKVKGGYRVLSKSGKNMGTYRTKNAARRRLHMVEWFKRIKK